MPTLKSLWPHAETFERYGIDRPFFLQGIQFNIVDRGANDSIVQVRSAAPITEPFLTFLVEATWSRGRLLREYTVLLDPPTFAPPAAQQAPVVQAPSRAAPSDSARIERQPPAPPAPAAPPAAAAESRSATASGTDSKPLPAAVDTPYDTSDGGEHNVQRGETLWGLATRMRPDSRLTINQTMMAIFEANPEAFNGNINRLKAGATIAGSECRCRVPDQPWRSVQRCAAAERLLGRFCAGVSVHRHSQRPPSRNPAWCWYPPMMERSRHG